MKPIPTTREARQKKEIAGGYVPALGFSWLTSLYDSLIAATLNEERFKRLLVEQARLAPGHMVLDLGCGTATLTIMLKRACPGATVRGLDGDPQILAIARDKARSAGVDVELREGMAYDPPFESGTFDRVVSSLVFHHLATENKRRTLARARALLRSGGELHVADWGKPHNLLMRAAFLGVQVLDGFETTADNARGLLVPLMAEAGFVDVAETHREMTLFGTLSCYRAVAP